MPGAPRVESLHDRRTEGFGVMARSESGRTVISMHSLSQPILGTGFGYIP